MHTELPATGKPSRRSTLFPAWIMLLIPSIGAWHATAQTYISAEPIPSEQVVGAANLTKILNLGYQNLQLWSNRLLGECRIVQDVIQTLAEN